MLCTICDILPYIFLSSGTPYILLNPLPVTRTLQSMLCTICDILLYISYLLEHPIFYSIPLPVTRTLQSMLCTICDILPCWGSFSQRSWVVQNYFRFPTRISRDLSSSTLCKWRHDNVSSPWYGKTDLVRLCASFTGAYCDFVLFAKVQSAPAVCSAYGPVRVLCSVKMVALQRAYSVAFISPYTMQQLTNSLLAKYNTKPHS